MTTVARTADGGEGGGGQHMVASLDRGWWLKLCEGGDAAEASRFRFRFRFS